MINENIILIPHKQSNMLAYTFITHVHFCIDSILRKPRTLYFTFILYFTKLEHSPGPKSYSVQFHVYRLLLAPSIIDNICTCIVV